MAKGKYIAYLNHDDLWFPHHLDTLLAPLLEHKLDVISSLSLNIKPPGINYREIIGLPRQLSNGTTDVTPMTSNVMHTQAAAEDAGGWIDWRETHAIPTLNFFRRLRALNGRFGVVNDITSLKFHSGDRKNSYRTQLATEQSFFARKIHEDPEFRYRESMKALAYQHMDIEVPRIPLPEKPEDAPPGWRIEQWRLNRGLEAKLNSRGSEHKSQGMLTEDESVVSILANDTALIVNDPSTPKKGQTAGAKPSLPRRLVRKIRFLQIPPRDGHPCRSANRSPCRVDSGLTPPSHPIATTRIGTAPVTALRAMPGAHKKTCSWQVSK